MTNVGGYAELVMLNPDEFDAVEVHGVRRLHLANDVDVEQDDERPEFYSVFAHMREGGVDCIGDFDTRGEADQYAGEIATRYSLRGP